MNRNRKIVVVFAVGIIALGLTGGGIAKADFTFGEPVNVGPTVNSPQGDGYPVLSRDGRELYFASNRPGGSGGDDIWMSQRASPEDPWGPPVNLGPGINSAGDDAPTSISSDGRTLYFHAHPGSGRTTLADLYTATRPTTDAPWGPRVNMGPVLNGPDGGGGPGWGWDGLAIISPDDLELFFHSHRAGEIGFGEVYVSTRATPADPWGPPVNLGPTINTSVMEGPGAISPDGLVLFLWAYNRPGGLGSFDTWMIRRPSKEAAWGEPVNLGSSFNTPQGEILMSISPDGQWAYISEHEDATGSVPATADLWMAPIIPTVDFNADGKVDLVDLVMLIDAWGTDDTLYDIGPYAWGDGKVDIEDLKVFIAEWEKQSPPAEDMFPDFIPTEGSPEGVAADKAGNVYVSVSGAASAQVWKFSPSGDKSILADLGAPGGGAVGLATDAAGNVYVCRAATTIEGAPVPNHGVYQVAPDGQVTLLPGTEQIGFANSLAFDRQETLYITELFSGDLVAKSFGPGGIWRLTKGGTAQLWVRDELLTGLPPSLFPFPVGANGIAFYRGDLYVANTDKALIVRVPVRLDGSAGQLEIWKQVEDVPESPFYGSPAFPVMVDGVAVDPQGNLYVAVPSRNAIVRINADDRSQETVAFHPQVPLDAPVSLAFGRDKSGGANLFITNLGMMKAFVPEVAWPGPGLVKISLQ